MAVFPTQSLPRAGKVANEVSRIGYWRYEKERGDRLKSIVYESVDIPDIKPSPRGEGAPKGRIGHWRYERQMRKTARCAAHVWKA